MFRCYGLFKAQESVMFFLPGQTVGRVLQIVTVNLNFVRMDYISCILCLYPTCLCCGLFKAQQSVMFCSLPGQTAGRVLDKRLASRPAHLLLPSRSLLSMGRLQVGPRGTRSCLPGQFALPPVLRNNMAVITVQTAQTFPLMQRSSC